MDLIQTKQKRAAREERNKYKPRTETGTTPSNQKRRQAGGFEVRPRRQVRLAWGFGVRWLDFNQIGKPSRFAGSSKGLNYRRVLFLVKNHARCSAMLGRKVERTISQNFVK